MNDRARDNERQALLRQAWALQSSGRFSEAETAYRQLLARWPHLSDGWYNLALVQRHAGHFDAALASYQQALDRGVSQPEEVHLNRGVIYWDYLRDAVSAEAELHAALRLNSGYLPALLNLANLREDFGRRDDALALYSRILGLAPHHFEALARYATLKSAFAADDPIITRLREAIADRDATAAERASLGFALGKVLDGCGAYDEAFSVCTAANAASRVSAGSRGEYDRRRTEAFFDQLIATFKEKGTRRADGDPADAPVFICGMFRSGSTLVEQVLAAHSRVTAGGENPFFPWLVRGPLTPFPAGMDKVTIAQRQQFAATYRALMTRQFPDVDRITDKRPDNFLYIGLIKTLFPHAKFVHTTRHPLDNCLSIHFLHLDQDMSYALDLLDTAHYYRQYRRLMEHWKSLYPEDILDLDYDALVHDPRPVMQRLLAFCDLEWEDACLSFERANTSVRTASAWQVRQPLYRASSGRWKNYASHIASLRGALRDLCPDDLYSDDD